MSVRGKALSALSAAFIVSLLGGCAVGSSDMTPANAEMNESMTSTMSSTEENVDLTSVNNVAPGAIETTTERIASMDQAGVGVTLERGAAFSRIVLDTGVAAPAFDTLSMNEPPRLVVDLLGREGSSSQAFDIASDSFLKRVRFGVHSDRTRVVFDLSDSQALAGHRVDSMGDKIVITLGDDSIAAASGARAQIKNETAAPMAEIQATSSVGQNAAAAVTVDTLSFEKTTQNGGEVMVGLTSPAAFELVQETPTEFVLSIPGAQAAKRTTIPQIAPAGEKGIRSARAVQEGEQVKIRMFVDGGVELVAKPKGNKIVVTTDQDALKAGSRAQLAEGEEEVAEDVPLGDGIVSADGSKVYMGRLISLDLQDTDIDNALRIIAEVSNLNIIASDDVTGKVTLRLIDVPWDQALDVILKTNGLDQVKEGNVIRIAPVEKLRAEREALKEAKRAAEELEDLTVNYLRVSYARVDELVEQVEAVLTERGSVSVDGRTNQLIVKDIAKGQRDVLELVRKLDLRTPQVLLETQIVEAQRNILRDLGFQWNYQYTASPATGNATGYNFPNSVSVTGNADAQGNAVNFPAVLTDAAGAAISAVLDSADGSRSLSARLSALETEGRVRVVSQPQVATVNNKEAEIKSVETVRVRLPDSGLSVATGSGASAAGGGNSAFEEIDVGIELTVTPQASPDYYVLMDIYAKSSTFGSNVVDNIPSTLEREATSTILVKSGQTFALGGVYRVNDTDQVQGVPFFKDLPVLGVFFRRSFIDKRDEELIFFITPHIVEGSFDPSLM